MRYSLTVTFALLFCITANAQFNETAKTQLVKEWQRAKAYTLEYLDAMPKDKFGFKALYEIIHAASKGKKILEEQEMQTLLLVEIARKLGVEETAIDEIIYESEAEPEPFKPD